MSTFTLRPFASSETAIIGTPPCRDRQNPRQDMVPESSNSSRCPACQASGPIDLLGIPRAPVTCTSIFATREQATSVPCGQLDLCACSGCGLVFNRSFDLGLGQEGARYESSQGASATFSAFARSLAEEWVLRHNLRNRPVVEVGCGQGDFMRQLLDAGVAKVHGVDPLAVAGNDPRVVITTAEFDPHAHDFGAAALVCRHALEHIPDVAGFLSRIRQWAGRSPDRIVLFELPDAERVFEERAFWDVYYEHCNYFTRATLLAAFELAGLEVLRMSRVYNDQYLLVEARAGASRPAPGGIAAADAIRTGRSFAKDASLSVRKCRESLEQLASQRRVVIWQGAAKTVGLLTFLGDTSTIECAVDLNPARQGCYLPGTGLPVHSPEALVTIAPHNIVLMNPAYIDEVGRMVRDLGVEARVHSINDLLRVG